MIGRPSVMLTPRQRVPAAGRGIDVEAEQLDRDVPLVVVHGDHGVVLAGAQLDEHGIAGHRADHVEAVGDRSARSSASLTSMSCAAEQAAFAGMRVQRRDGDPARARCRDRASASWVRSMTRRSRSGVSRFGTSSSATCVVTWLTRMLPWASIITEPRAPVSSASISVWPAIVVAGLVQRLLVERRGDDAAASVRPAPAARPARSPDRRSGRHRPTARPGWIGSPSGPACRQRRARASRRRPRSPPGWRGRGRARPRALKRRRCCR